MGTNPKQTRLSPEFVILGFLYEQPDHGYDLHRRLLDEFGFIWHVSQSQTYNILKRLENQGTITSQVVEQEKLPDRQCFHLNETGRRRFMTWLESPTKCSVHSIRVEFITRLYFIQRFQPANIQIAIQAQIQEVEIGLSHLEQNHTQIPEDQIFNSLALNLRIKLLRSILNWLEDCHVIFSTQQEDEA